MGQKTIYSIKQDGADIYVKTISPLTETQVLSEALVYEEEPPSLSAATYLNSLGLAVTYLSVGRPDDRHPHS